MRRFTGVALVAGIWAGVMAAGAARASDGDGEQTLGLESPGLTLAGPGVAAPESTTIQVTTDKIAVRHRFTPKITAPETRYGYFIVSSIGADLDAFAGVMGADPSRDPASLKVTVDGKPVTLETIARVNAAGIDATALLESLKVPLTPFGAASKAAIAALAPDVKADLVARGLLDGDKPNWFMDVSHGFKLVFEPGRTTEVAYETRPVVGKLDQAIEARKGKVFYGETEDLSEALCLTKEQSAEVKKKTLARKDGKPAYTLRQLSLAAGAPNHLAEDNGKVEVTVDVPRPVDMLASCALTLKKAGPTRYEFKSPTYDIGSIDLLILEARD